MLSSGRYDEFSYVGTQPLRRALAPKQTEFCILARGVALPHEEITFSKPENGFAFVEFDPRKGNRAVTEALCFHDLKSLGK
jgi:hypothetical protein